MAANLQTVGRGITSLGKRFVNRQIWSGSSSSSTKISAASALSRTGATRGAHYSVYDKNVDEQVRPTVVPDELIQPESDKYWGPNPRTGVFGPASTDPNAGGGGDESSLSSVGNGESVLEQKAWFRPLEDVEKPQQY